MSFSKINELLYEKHYLNYRKSSEVSSHWNDYFKKYKINKKGEKFEFFTSGLFSYEDRKIDFFKNIFIKFNLFFFIRKYKLDLQIIKNAKKLNKILDIDLTFDLAKNYIICNIFKKFSLINQKKVICIIGDGYGYLGQLLKFINRDIKVIYINLGINLLIDSYFYSLSFKKETPLLLSDNNINKIERSSVIFIEAENFYLLNHLKVDFFINVASMQEMEFGTIKKYFDVMRKNKSQPMFYCCNRISKKLNEETIIKFDDYPWDKKDQIIFEEECIWYNKYPTYIPFYWKSFNGKLKHKLVKMELSK